MLSKTTKKIIDDDTDGYSKYVIVTGGISFRKFSAEKKWNCLGSDIPSDEIIDWFVKYSKMLFEMDNNKDTEMIKNYE